MYEKKGTGKMTAMNKFDLSLITVGRCFYMYSDCINGDLPMMLGLTP